MPRISRELDGFKPSSVISAKEMVRFPGRDLQMSDGTFIMRASPWQASVEAAVLVSSDADVEVDVRRSVLLPEVLR